MRPRPSTFAAAAATALLAVGLVAGCGSSSSSSAKFSSVSSAIGGDPVGPTGTAGPSSTFVLTGPSVPALGRVAGEELCGLLTTADFEAAGVTGTTAPTITSDGPGSAYCVFAGQSAATGGVELDVFVAADAAEAEATYRTVQGESPAVSPLPVALPGLDAGELDPGGPDRPATVVVRRGNLVVAIGLPAGPEAGDQLQSLLATALQRGADLSS